jgi:hypothetical protein
VETNALQLTEAGKDSPIEAASGSTQSAWHDAGLIAFLTTVQFIWLALFADVKIALINLLPAAVFLTVWALFINRYYADRPKLRNWLLLPALILTLRLPITLHQGLQFVNWLMCAAVVGIVVRQVLTIFESRESKIVVLIGAVLVLMNASHHLGLNSPYTYSFRLINGQPSAFQGFDNNATWECAYERPKYAVHCDARHFIASERIFTEKSFDPSYSVLLQRFLHGYLNSLAGMEGTRWWVNLGVNMTFWFFACICVYRICTLLKIEQKVAQLALLCCASAWGFVAMVAQPAPYMLAFAYAPIIFWATLELIYGEWDQRGIGLLVLLIASVVMVYDAWQLILASALLLFLHKKRAAAGAVVVLPIVFTLIWKFFSMQSVLGTQGDVVSPGSTPFLLKMDIHAWWDVVTNFKVVEFFRFSKTGVLAYLYGNLIIGARAALAYITLGWHRRKTATPEQKTLLITLVAVNALVLASMIFVTPHLYFLSPSTGMQPRIAFYSYTINLIALMLLTYPWLKSYAWVVPLLLLIFANINLSGWVGIDMMFDYGTLKSFWK